MGSLHGSLVKISVKLLEDTGEPGHTFRRYHGTDRAQIRRIFILYIIHYECRICSSNLRYTIKRQMGPGRCQIKGLRRTGQQSVIRNAHECPAPCSDLR